MPISAFASALRAFSSGELTQDELSWEIDRQLAVEKASPVALLEVLQMQQVAQPLPSATHDAIVHHLEEWPRDPTIITGAKREAAARPPGVGVGDILQGRFSLIALVGEGGMSRVFKAIDLRRVEAAAADPFVAVKVLTEPYGEYFGSIVALQRETHKLQSLSHANIVRVIDCDRDDHTVFMTMEFLAGESLQHKLRHPSGLDETAAVALVATVGQALEYAHRSGIVHGDLKPGNVIVTDKGVVKVIDFGMARFLTRPEEERSAEPASQSTPKAVTPRYASPELVAGRDPEPADDVYALACMAYEALCGQHPFGPATDPRGRDPLFIPPRPPRMRRRHYTALVKALAFDRARRTAGVREFLDHFLGRRRHAVVNASRTWLAVGGVVAGALALWAVAPRSGVEAIRPIPPMPAGTTLRDCALCPAMTVIPAGRFKQGSVAADASPFEKPVHRVIIARPFAMSTDEITVGEFREFAAVVHRDFAGCNVYDGRWTFRQSANWQSPGFEQSASHPVACVSWDDAVAYAGWLSARSGRSYRLPSASEWEYAARAGGEPVQPWGSEAGAACAQANVADQSAAQRYPGWTVFPCTDGFVNTAPVGSFQANAFGIHDLLGNVFEWVEDCWQDDYAGAPVDGSARGGACRERELRGGSWFTSPRFVSASGRNRFDSGYRSSAVGFRLVRDL